MSPVKKVSYDDSDISAEMKHELDELFHWRQVIWWDTLHFMMNDSVATELIGVDLDGYSFAGHNSIGRLAHSMYLTVIYGMGIIGITVLLCFAWSVICNVFLLLQDKENIVMPMIIISSFMIFLIMGISTDAIEFTQMSWFPFIFAGAGISLAGKMNE